MRKRVRKQKRMPARRLRTVFANWKRSSGKRGCFNYAWAVSTLRRRYVAETNNVLLEVQGLKKYFPVQQGFLRRTVGYVKAVDDVNLMVKAGETLGVVGESGC